MRALFPILLVLSALVGGCELSYWMPIPFPELPEPDVELPDQLPEDDLFFPEVVGELDSEGDVADQADESDGETQIIEDLSETDGAELDPERQRWVIAGVGTMVFELAPFSWSFRASYELGSKAAVPLVGPSIAVEAGDKSQGFHDPTEALSYGNEDWWVVDVDQAYEGGPLILQLAPEADGAATLELTVFMEGAGFEMHFKALNPARRIEFAWSDEGGPLYGGGARRGPRDGRGELIPLFNDAPGFATAAAQPVQEAIPFLLNPAGYALFFESAAPGVLDLREESRLSARFGAAELTLHLWYGSAPEQLLTELMERVPAAPSPPFWALAPMLSVNAAEGQAAALALVAELEDSGLKLGGLLVDSSWQSAYNDLQFNPQTIGEAAALYEALAQREMALLLSVSPYLDLSDDSDVGAGWGPATELYQQGAAAELLVMDGAGNPALFDWASGRRGALMDFSHEDTAGWWAAQADPQLSGVGGLVLERGVDLYPRLDEGLSFANGETALTQATQYSRGFEAAAANLLSREQALLLSERRDPFARGAHALLYRPLSEQPWEALAEFARVNFNLSASGANAVVIPPAIEAASDALILRWLAVSLLNPVPVLGQGQAQALLNSPRALAAAQQMLRLRRALTLYIDAQLRSSSTLPLVRPLAFGSGNDEEAWQSEGCYFGEDMVAYPFFDANEGTRNVHLPPGYWRNWYTGAVFFGPKLIQIQGGIEQLPLFIREEKVFPMLFDEPLSLEQLAALPNALARTGGFPEGSVTLVDGSELTLLFEHPEGTRDVILEKAEATHNVYVLLLGVYPAGLSCDESAVLEDAGLFVDPNAEPEDNAWRLLPQGTLLRLSGSHHCSFVFN